MADNEILQMHDLKPAPGAKKDRTRVAAVKAPRVRPPVVAPRARRSATTCVRALKAASCRCTCACRSFVASRTRSRSSSRSSTSLVLVELFPEGGEVAVAD